MQISRHIRKFLAVSLLAIFALSNTPTNILHRFFANHTDFVSSTLNNSGHPELSVAGINCHCNNLVVISPYLAGEAFVPRETTFTFGKFISAKSVRTLPSEKVFFELRGPPSIS